jgi:hypothetical protein
VEFFHACGKGESFGEAITRFRPSGLKMKLARSATVGILIPTKPMMLHLDLQKFETFEEEVQCMEDCRVMYASECLYHRDGDFYADYGDTSVEDKLEIWRVSCVSHQCLSRASRWCSSVTTATLTKTMCVCIQGWSDRGLHAVESENDIS